MVVRGDCGTENCSVAQIQIAFHMNHDDDQSKVSFMVLQQLT